MRNRMARAMVRGVGVLLVVGLVGTAAVLVVDAVRAARNHPEACTGEILIDAQARGESLDNAEVVAEAWRAVSDRETHTLGALDGDLLVAERTCTLYAGRLMGSESVPGQPPQTVVFVETNVAGHQDLVRFAEVQLGKGTGPPTVAVAAHSVLLGSELRAGVLLPLSGTFLAGAGRARPLSPVTAVTVLSAADGFTEERRAESVGDGMFRIGITADLRLAPNEQVPDVDAVLLLERERGGTEIVVVPAARNLADNPAAPRVVFAVQLVDDLPVDAATARRLGPVVQGLSADRRFMTLLDLAHRQPTLDITFGPDGATVRSTDPNAEELPTFELPGR